MEILSILLDCHKHANRELHSLASVRHEYNTTWRKLANRKSRGVLFRRRGMDYAEPVSGAILAFAYSW